MDTGEVVSIVSAGASGFFTLAGIVWMASKAQATTVATAEKIVGAVDRLELRIGELSTELKAIQRDHHHHDVRLTVLETVAKLERNGAETIDGEGGT